MRTHQNSDLLLVNRPVPIDSPNTAYLSFNNSLASSGHQMCPLVGQDALLENGDGDDLNTHTVEGITQRYSISSSQSNINASAVAKYGYNLSKLLVPAKFGSGLICDEDTSNLAVGTLTPYASYNTMTRNGQNLIFTMTIGGAHYLTFHNGINYNGRIIAMSGYMKKNGVPHQIPGNRASTYHTVPALRWYFDLTTGYFEIVENCNASSLWLFHTSAGTVDGDIITIDNFQVEEKTYVTSFVNGTRTQIPVSYPYYSAKTLSLWTKSTSNKATTGITIPRTVVSLYKNSTYYWRIHAMPSDDIYTYPNGQTKSAGQAVLEICISNPTPTVNTFKCTVPGINILDGEWHHITVEHHVISYTDTAYCLGSGNISRITVDGIPAETVELRSYGPTSAYAYPYKMAPGTINMGHFTEGELSGNFIIDDVRIDTGSYLKDDVRRRFISNTEYYQPYGYISTCIVE